VSFRISIHSRFSNPWDLFMDKQLELFNLGRPRAFDSLHDFKAVRCCKLTVLPAKLIHRQTALEQVVLLLLPSYT
jgi:hypothetical protein